MSRSPKQFIKAHAPQSAWSSLRSSRRWLRVLAQRLRQRAQIRQWKRMLGSAPGPQGSASMECAALRNSLPNSGGIPAEAARVDPVLVAKSNTLEDSHRAAGIVGFEGLALADALGWLEPYRHYSFVPLAQAISRIAAGRRGRDGFSVLELGCGGGGFRVLLESCGANAYLGIDANPLPFAHSPYMLQAPGNYRHLNLQETIDFGMAFDVVCSFEVLEHINEDRLDHMLRTIANHLAPGSVFLGTAALTDCFDVHITVHPRDWWLERFARHGILPVNGVQGTDWMDLLARSHPFNWNASSTSIFVLQKP